MNRLQELIAKILKPFDLVKLRIPFTSSPYFLVKIKTRLKAHVSDQITQAPLALLVVTPLSTWPKTT